MDLRCGPRLHGRLVEGTTFVEFKCNSALCGHRVGSVVFHRFDTVTGRLVETLQFKDPRKGKQ